MLLDSWRLAIGTLSALPVAPPRHVDRRRAGLAMVLAPLAMLPAAVVLVAVAAGGHVLELPVAVTALLVVAAVVLGNRGFHLDGLSDTADGLAASYDPERSLEVMKSGSSGPAGTAAVVVVLALQAALLTSLLGGGEWLRDAVLAAACLVSSRAVLTLCCLRGVRPARPDGLGSGFTETVPIWAAGAVVVAAAAGLSLLAAWSDLDWWRGLLGAALAVAVTAALIARTTRRFGGVTGDVFGAAVEVAFVATLVAVA